MIILIIGKLINKTVQKWSLNCKVQFKKLVIQVNWMILIRGLCIICSWNHCNQKNISINPSTNHTTFSINQLYKSITKINQSINKLISKHCTKQHWIACYIRIDSRNNCLLLIRELLPKPTMRVDQSLERGINVKVIKKNKITWLKNPTLPRHLRTCN